MRMYRCFCNNDIDITARENNWMLIAQSTVKKIEYRLNEPDGIEYFLDTYGSLNEPSRTIVCCPFCDGFIMHELRYNRFATMYYLPQRHYEKFSLSPPEQLDSFTCDCGVVLDTRNLHNQWTMIPTAEIKLAPIIDAIEDKEGQKGYYREIYKLGRRVICCDKCFNITVVKCDSRGNGLKAEYYMKKSEEIGKEFDLNLLGDYWTI